MRDTNLKITFLEVSDKIKAIIFFQILMGAKYNFALTEAYRSLQELRELREHWVNSQIFS